ncbi:hypothetical protein QTG54_016120 [Skeletonema marinoi]|uniref:Uncharacterized protein n=1 Tax=Skeletonema marinoi TaxID=267567 RepID=A0AAD8XTE7_9STRA|nr:hypothetical protein QTG54_016120 [Skeletonema marinoi]
MASDIRSLAFVRRSIALALATYYIKYKTHSISTKTSSTNIMMSSTAAHLFTPEQPPSSTQQLLLLASCPPRPRRRTAATAATTADDFASISTLITTSSSRNLPPTIPILNNLHQQQFLPSFHNHHIPTITLKPRLSSLHLKKKATRSPIKVCRAVKHSVSSDMKKKQKKSPLRKNPNSYNQLGSRNRNQQMIGSGSSRHRSASFSSPAA